MKRLSRLFTLSFLVVLPACTSAKARDVPYVQTPREIVQKMLQMGRVGPGDIVYDLGSGDGRIVISAVRDFNADKAVGIDIDPARIIESEQNAEAAGVADRTEFIQQDIFEADFSEATVLTMYLLSRVNLRLRPRILSELEPGSRVVSHQFAMGDWEPDETARIGGRTVYLWIVPAKVQGAWRCAFDGREYRVELSQQYQQVTGEIKALGAGSPEVRLANAELVGDRLRLTAYLKHDNGTAAMRLDGRVEGNRLSGELSVNGRTSPVAASRVD